MASFKDLCRFCIKYTNSAVCLNHTDTDKVKFIDKLKFLFNDLILDEDNKTPFQICSTCCKKIKQTYDFKKQCTTSYEYWQLHFHTSLTIKDEPVEKLPTVVRKRGRPKKVKTENQLVVDSLKNNDGSVLKPNNNEPNPNILNLKSKLSTLLKPEIKIKEENSDEIVAPIKLNFTSLKSKLGNALKIGILNNEEGNITPILKPITKKRTTQNYYSINKSIYLIDMKRKRFYCKSCNKYFLNLRSLKVHIVQDLGIKNIPCRLCRKRFFSRRELKSHLQKNHL